MPWTHHDTRRLARKSEAEERARKEREAMQFTHTPRPAVTPQRADHAKQRRFGPNPESVHYLPLGKSSSSSASVLRWDGEPIASVCFSTGIGNLEFPATPDQLRELARRLIDAAHDIEANP